MAPQSFDGTEAKGPLKSCFTDLKLVGMSVFFSNSTIPK